jgi:two-component sensor histidine kinase
MPSQAAKTFSTPVYLLGLIAGVVVPLLLFAGYLLNRHAATERFRFEEEAERTARQVGLIVDAELERLVALLRGLAASSALVNGDLGQFHGEATRLVQGRDEIIVLRDLGSRQFLNTQRPYGTELPKAVALSAADLSAFANGQPRISDVYTSPISREARIAVALPVVRAGEATQVLAITVPTGRIREVLLPAVPPGWIVGIGDGRGTYVTRSARHDDYTGKPGLPEYLAKASGKAGTFTSVNLEGIQLLAGYYRSPFSNWLFAANIPQSVVEAPLRRSLALLAMAGASALVLSIVLAYLFGRVFTTATTGLAQRAAALAKGEPVPPMSSRLADFTIVAEALRSAAATIERKSEERRLLVNELNHRVKNNLAIVQSIATQTLRGTALTEVREALARRLQALAKTHDLLTKEAWEGADLRDLVKNALAPLGGTDRFIVNGPSVRLSSSLSVLLAMALHELATNATKYGALSVEGGTVRVSWEVNGDPPALTLRWIEHGGPAVQPPTGKGFGSRLIETGFAGIGGRASIDYTAEGLRCVVDMPLESGR